MILFIHQEQLIGCGDLYTHKSLCLHQIYLADHNAISSHTVHTEWQSMSSSIEIAVIKFCLSLN